MRVIQQTEENEIANVYVAETDARKRFEFVESTQPPLSIHEKWVLIISTLYGCPVDCKFCDAGGTYQGRLSREELLFQIDYLVNKRFPGGLIDTDKFKIQFARMGEPSLNPHVLEVLKELPSRYTMKHFIPSVSSIGPVGTESFFNSLLDIKKTLYNKTFQLQFSIHSTNEAQRDKLIPVRKMSFEELATYGARFYSPEGKKITLNFAIGADYIIKPKDIKDIFDPELFLIKVTPVNPTLKARRNNIQSLVQSGKDQYPIIDAFKANGYEVLLSIGEWEENKIGSNCGQYVSAMQEDSGSEIYSYCLRNA
ncbi:MAG: radical SAM protein [Bacteroidota bacterium]|nr:radical SAM protein [Bacteroidota bacterium]